MNYKNALITLFAAAVLLTSGCASVPMASEALDAEKKAFENPPANLAGLYIYRNSSFGGALKKTITVNGEVIGSSAPMTYFYKQVPPGPTTISTESEFSDNTLTIDAAGGKNHFVRQYLRIGVFVGGANLEAVSEEEGKEGVLECKLAEETRTPE